jgi:hypothetical protein
MGEYRNVYSIFVRKPQGGLRCRCENNIKTDLRDTGWGGMNWIDLAQNREQWRATSVVNRVMNPLVP